MIASRANRRKQILRSAVAAAAAGLIPAAAQATALTWNGGGVDNNWSTVFNWSPAQAPVSGDTLTFDGFGRLTNSNDIAGLTINGVTFAPTAGAFSIGGTQGITLGGDIADNTPVLTEAMTLTMALNANRNVGVTQGGFLTLSGVVSGGGFGLNKTGLGTLTLGGTNTYSGATTIAAGTLRIGADANLGAAPGAATANSLVVNGGTLNTTASFTINSNRGIAVGPTSGTGSSIFDVASGTTLTYGGIMANNGTSTSGITKTSFGTLTLTGSNSYTGPTSIKNGGLTLNFSATGAPASNIINPLSSLSMGGATAGLGQNNNSTLTMTGKTATANVQTFAGTNIDIYGSLINVTKGTGTASATLNLGVLTHTLGGTLVVPTVGATQGVVNATGTTLDHGIIGGWAVAGTPTTNRGITMGSSFATLDVSGNIIAYPTASYVTLPVYDGTAGSTMAGNAAIQANADKNVTFTSAAVSEYRVDAENANTTTDINTLSYSITANPTLVIGTGNTLRLGRYGGIFKTTTGNNQLFIGGTGGALAAGPNANAGNLTAGGAPNTPGEIVLTQDELNNNNGTITIVSNIVNNGTGAVSVIKTGVASIKIDGHNSYSGGTFVNQGRFQLAGSEQLRDPVNTSLTVGNPDGLGSGPVTVAPGAYVYLSGVNGTAVFTGPGAIAGAIAGSAQNAPILNNFTLSGFGTNQEGIGAIRFGNRSIVSGQITLGGDARLSNGNAPAYPAINGDGSTIYFDPGNLISGKITGGFALDFGSANSVATNLMINNPANDWTGNTSLVNGGGNTTLRLGASQVIPDGVGKGNLVWGSGVSSNTNLAIVDLYGNNETVNGLSTTTANLGGVFVQNNGFTPTIIDDVNNPGFKTYSYAVGTSTLTVGGFDASATFGGIIRDNDPAGTVSLPDPNGATTPITVTAPWAGSKVALTKIGGGIQTLTGVNTYTGDTNVNAGTLAVNGSLVSSGNVNVTGASAALAGTGSVGNVSVSTGGHVRPGSAGTGTIGTLTANSLTVNNGDLGIDFGGGLSDSITTGSAAFSGSNTISPSGSPSAGTYVVVNSGTAITGAGTLTLNAFPNLPDTRPAAGTLDLTNPNQVKINVTGGAKTLTWTGGTNSTWDKGTTGTVNWQDTTPAAERFFNADLISFGDGPVNRNITLNLNVKPGSITFTNSFGNDYTISGTGNIDGTTGITMNGAGTVTIGTNNTFNGGLTQNNGVLVLSGTNTPGTITINAGTLRLANTLTGNPNSTGTIEVANGGDLSGTITNNGTVRFVRTDVSTFSGGITSGGSVEKNNTGTVVLNGANTYTGLTTVNAGVLGVTAFTRLGGASGPVIIASGGQLDLGAIPTANVAGGFGAKQFYITGDGPDGNGAIYNTGLSQTAAFQQIALQANASVSGVAAGRFDVRGGTATLDLTNNTLTKNGANQFSVVGGTAGATITNGNIVVNGGTFSMEQAMNVPAGGTITYNAGTTAQFFQVNNTTGGILRDLVFNGTTVTNNNQAVTSTVDSNITLAQATPFTINNTGTGPQLVLTGTISSTGGVNKSGTGTMVISGNATYTGNTTVSAGVLRYTKPFKTGASVNVTGGMLEMASDGSYENTLKTGAVTVAGGKLNLQDNKLVVTGGAAGSTWNGAAYDGVTGQVATGYDGGLNDGNGIMTSQSNAVSPNVLTQLVSVSADDSGYAGGVFGGANVAAGDQLVMYTWGGDANLDGTLNGDDYFQIDSHFNQDGLVFGYFNGDFNYDGAINGDDYFIIDSNFNAGSSGTPFPTSAGAGGPLAGVQAVPEPASLSMLALAATGLLARRRRSR